MKLFRHLCALTWLIYGHQDICLWQQFLYGHQELSSPQNILAPKGAWGHNYLLSLELRRPLLLMWYLAAPCLCPIWTWQKSGRRRCLCSLHIKRERLLSVNQKIDTFSLPSFHQPREVHLSPRSFCAPNSWCWSVLYFGSIFVKLQLCTTLRKLSPSRAVPLISFRTFSTSLLFSAASKSRRFFWKQ